ncbi:unnamed protein product [Tenebrio molitor]|nr:unnamed protein product [Tenebrio molitor]
MGPKMTRFLFCALFVAVTVASVAASLSQNNGQIDVKIHHETPSHHAQGGGEHHRGVHVQGRRQELHQSAHQS